MDRREVAFVAVLLLALAVGPVASAAAPALPFQEGFESFPNGAYPAADGWAVLMTGKSAFVTQTASHSGLGSFRLDSWPWSGRMDCVTLDALPPDHLSYQASVCADRVSGNAARVGLMSIFSMFDRTGLMWDYFLLDAKTGRIMFYGQSPVNLGACVRGQWYKLQADLDFESLVADLWVNDVLVAAGVPITPREFTDSVLGPIVLNKFGVSSPMSSAMSNIVYFDDIALWEPETTIEVEIDIKPGDNSNPINLNARGVIPVAVFSSDTFDATQIDPATALLAGAPVAVTGGKNAKWMAHAEDVDGDGLLDLVLQFANQALDPTQLQDGIAILTGATYDGDEIEGQDDIVLVGHAVTNRALR